MAEQNGNVNREVLQAPITSPMLEPEMWLRCFQHVSEPDLLRAMNTCPEFNQMLDSQKTTILWPMVLPHVMEYLPKFGIFDCRAVNQKGKAVVDTVVQTQMTSPDTIFRSRIRDTLSSYHCSWGKSAFADECMLNFYFTSKEKIEECMSSIDDRKTPAHNPFINRTVYIEFSNEETKFTSIQGYNSLLTFLFRYGQHIWIIGYLVECQENDTLLCNLHTFLRATPNLKVLELGIGDVFPFEGPVYQEFPILPQLESLRIEGDVSNSTIRSLVRMYGPQLTVIICEGNFLGIFDNEADTFLDPNLLSHKLKKLAIKDFFPKKLAVLAQVNWQIESLALGDNSLRRSEPCAFANDILATICHFSNTLVELILDLGSVVFEEYPNFDVLPLMSKLTNLTLAVAPPLINEWLWNFIVTNCRNLREITFIDVDAIKYPYIKCNLTKYRRMVKPLFAKMSELDKIVIYSGKMIERRVVNEKIVVTRPNTN